MPADDAVGVGAHARGLAGHQRHFAQLRDRAAREFGREPWEATKDYWLIASVYAVASQHTDGHIYDDDGNLLGSVAFGGGTSLVAAWSLCRRFSEDVDLLIFTANDEIAGWRSANERLLRASLSAIPAAIGGEHPPAEAETISGRDFRSSQFTVGGREEYLKCEATVEAPLAGCPLSEPRRVMSMMGRSASKDELGAFPELGGFEIECVTPEYTAFNKFDALHRRAVMEDYAGMTLRGRDAYDLSRIALSDRAGRVRPLIEAAQERVARPRSKRRQLPRPDGGYAYSPAFDPDGPAYAALQQGYERMVQGQVWDDALPFAEAVDLARSLDA